MTYVYSDDPGQLGTLLESERRVLRFGVEGSGIIELDALVASESVAPYEIRIPVRLQEHAMLTGPLAELLANEPLPCLVGHAAATALVLLGADSVARCSAASQCAASQCAASRGGARDARCSA